MNFFEKRNKKSNLSKDGIATILGTEKKKIEELERGERIITGETFKKYIDATNMSETEVKLEYAKLVEWYKNTNLRKLRHDFGYMNLRSVANKIGIHYSTLSNIENHKVNKPDFAILFKLKDFYSNDFNKNLEKKEENVEIKVKESENKNTEVKNENSEIDNIKKWYKNTDLKKIMLKYNLDYKNTSKDLNIPYSSFYELINKKNKAHNVERIANLKTYIDNLENQNNAEISKDILKELQDGIKVEEDNNISEIGLETTKNDVFNNVFDENNLDLSEKVIDYTPLFVETENSIQQLSSSDIEKKSNNNNSTEIDILNLKIIRYEKIIDILLKQLGE